jgi:hypothetical protein
MALIPCAECQKEISSEAASCPHCGRPQRPMRTATMSVGRGALYTVGAALVLGAIYAAVRTTTVPAYGERPSYFVGKWVSTDTSVGAVLDLSADGRYRETGNPYNTDHRSGIWGVLPPEPDHDQQLMRFCLKDGAFEKCDYYAPITVGTWAFQVPRPIGLDFWRYHAPR